VNLFIHSSDSVFFFFSPEVTAVLTEDCFLHVLVFYTILCFTKDSHIFISDSVSTLLPSQEEVLGCHKCNE